VETPDKIRTIGRRHFAFGSEADMAGSYRDAAIPEAAWIGIDQKS